MTDTIHFMITVITLLPLNKKVCSECLGGRRTHVWLILVELEGHFTLGMNIYQKGMSRLAVLKSQFTCTEYQIAQSSNRTLIANMVTI